MGTSVKTGAPIGPGGSKDYKDIIPAIGAQVGISNLSTAIDFFVKHRGVIAAILRLFGIGKKDEVPQFPSTPPAPEPVPSPTPGTPAPTPGPAPTPTRGPVRGLRAKWWFIERKNDLSRQGGGRHILGKGEFEQIVNRDGILRLGDRIHVNITPYDDRGDFMPGGEENKLLLNSPNDDPNWSPNHRIKHLIVGNGELTSEYDDYGCTPVILVPWEQGKVDSDEESTVGYQPTFRGEGGNIEGPELKTLRIKA